MRSFGGFWGFLRMWGPALSSTLCLNGEKKIKLLLSLLSCTASGLKYSRSGCCSSCSSCSSKKKSPQKETLGAAGSSDCCWEETPSMLHNPGTCKRQSALFSCLYTVHACMHACMHAVCVCACRIGLFLSVCLRLCCCFCIRTCLLVAGVYVHTPQE